YLHGYGVWKHRGIEEVKADKNKSKENAYELKGKFLDDLHNNDFSGTNRKDVVEHIEYYLKIIGLIKLPNVDHDKLRIVIFPISLAGGSDEIEVSDDESSDLEEYWSDKEETSKLVLLENFNENYSKYLRLMIDYALWEVIENVATLPKTTIIEGVVTEMPITTTGEKAQRRLEVKPQSTLMMGITNEHQLKSNSIKDAKKLVEALELLDEKLSQEDVNQKLLRSLSPEWNTHAVVWRNKADLDTMSMDDLYNNLKVYKPEVKGMSSSSSSTQNMAFVSSSNNNISSTNEAVNTAHGVSTASTQVNTANSTNIDNLSDAVICAFFISQPNSP
ncbi:hypothetical protein Tco_1296298, partial [Tanacetum coccineum]